MESEARGTMTSSLEEYTDTDGCGTLYTLTASRQWLGARRNIGLSLWDFADLSSHPAKKVEPAILGLWLGHRSFSLKLSVSSERRGRLAVCEIFSLHGDLSRLPLLGERLQDCLVPR
jgi:hypothetical protein